MSRALARWQIGRCGRGSGARRWDPLLWSDLCRRPLLPAPHPPISTLTPRPRPPATAAKRGERAPCRSVLLTVSATLRIRGPGRSHRAGPPPEPLMGLGVRWPSSGLATPPGTFSHMAALPSAIVRGFPRDLPWATPPIRVTALPGTCHSEETQVRDEQKSQIWSISSSILQAVTACFF